MTEYDPNYFMEPERDPVWANFTFTGPEEDIGDLRVCRTEDEQGRIMVVSGWTLSAVQRQMIRAGATIRLSVWMPVIPPLAVGVEPPWCPSHRQPTVYDYTKHEFYCMDCPRGDTDAQDDPDAPRSAAPDHLTANFTTAPDDAPADPTPGKPSEGSTEDGERWI